LLKRGVALEWDVVIVGAGPSGCFTAQQIASAGFKVLLIEEHEKIGEPVQCAGLISPRAVKLAEISQDLIINNLTSLRVFSLLGSNCLLKSRDILAQAIERGAFDKILAERAVKSGAELLLGTTAKDVEAISGGYRLTLADKYKRKLEIDTRLLIGADGANSMVARWLNLTHDNPKAVMFAADVELQPFNTGCADVFLGQDLAPGWFGWIIPLSSNVCRVGSGYALINSSRSPRHFFEMLVDKYPHYFKGMRIIRQTGGVVPIGLMPKIYAAHAMLVGDAACQVKPISGGGIYLGLRGALLCGQLAVKALQEGNLTEKALATYQKKWEQEMGEEIACGLAYRKCYLDFTDQDIDRLIRLLDQTVCQNLIMKHGDIDHPSLLAKKLFNLTPWWNNFFKLSLKMADVAHFL
jgi:digeranylgeranylglycerophospholipid reductase